MREIEAECDAEVGLDDLGGKEVTEICYTLLPQTLSFIYFNDDFLEVELCSYADETRCKDEIIDYVGL